jgi:hypothetical protein
LFGFVLVGLMVAGKVICGVVVVKGVEPAGFAVVFCGCILAPVVYWREIGGSPARFSGRSNVARNVLQLSVFLQELHLKRRLLLA